MRHIDPKTFQDDFFGIQLDMTERLIWLGIIISVADDQGRLLGNPALLRSQIFPCDDGIPLDLITNAIDKMVSAGKIYRYQAGGKSLLQVVNWWKYQSSASWMSPSKYPAPEGWQDCYRYHAAGNEMVISPNWKKRSGGFVSPEPLPSTLPSDDVNVNADDNENGEKEQNAQPPAPAETPTASPASKSKQKQAGKPKNLPARQELCEILQTAELPSGWEAAIHTYTGLLEAHGPKVREIAQLVVEHWVNTSRKNGPGTYSKLNPAWMDWLVAYFAGEKPWERAGHSSGSDFASQLAAAGYSR